MRFPLTSHSFPDADDDDGRGRWMTSELQKINSRLQFIFRATLSSSTPLLPDYTTTTTPLNAISRHRSMTRSYSQVHMMSLLMGHKKCRLLPAQYIY